MVETTYVELVGKYDWMHTRLGAWYLASPRTLGRGRVSICLIGNFALKVFPCDPPLPHSRSDRLMTGYSIYGSPGNKIRKQQIRILTRISFPERISCALESVQLSVLQLPAIVDRFCVGHLDRAGVLLLLASR